jgi:hypothetical protein
LSRPSRAAVLFTVIFAAALAATVLVLGSRTTELVLEVTRLPKSFSPNGDDFRDKAEIRFLVRVDEPAAEVLVVGRDLEPIRTLGEDVALRRDEPVTYLWDARTDDGRPAPVGRYRLRVILPSHDRDMVWPRRVDLERPPPRKEAGG